MNIPILFFAACFLLFGLILRKLWQLSTVFKHDPQEPPLVPSKVPYIGHLLGLIRQPHRYLFELHKKTNHPISTLRMLNGKVYVLNSPHLVQAAFKSKSLSFAPLVNEYVSRMDELSPMARRIYAEDGMHERMMLLFQTRMTGSSLKEMNAVAMGEISSIFQQSPQPQGTSVLEVENLWVWMRNIMTTVTTSTLLGTRNNPWRKDPSLIDSYWAWESGDISRRTPLAAIKDRQSHQGRIAIQRALTSYFATGDFSKKSANDVSNMASDTAAMQKQYDFGSSDLGAAFTQVIHASLMNVVPTTFWVLVHIFSRPELLAVLRQEAISAMKEDEFDDSTGTRYVSIDLDRPEALFPRLMSAFQEAHRLATAATLHRRVVEDTYLSEGNGTGTRPYLLKKGITVMIPTTVSLRSPQVWGGQAAAGEFDPERFLAQPSKKKQESHNGDAGGLPSTDSISNIRKKAYFPFGGGKELCPGRNFAKAEVMGTLLVLLSGFDIVSADGGTLTLPMAAKPRLTTGTMRPDPTAKLGARISRRAGWEKVVWRAAAVPNTTV